MARSRQTADQINLNLQSQITSILDRVTGTISGLILSRPTLTTFGVAVGAARSENAGTSRQLQITSAFTKGLGAFAVGTGNGALDTGTIAANSWYHVHIIRRDSDAAIDFLLSLSPTAPTMPSGWVARRRIGSLRTNASSQLIAFTQLDDLFLWDVPVADVSAVNPGTAAVSRTLTVPSGLAVWPVVAWSLDNLTTAAVQALISPLQTSDQVPTANLCTLATLILGAGANAVVGDIPTSTGGQIRTRLSVSGASDALRGTTLGWIDRRGRG